MTKPTANGFFVGLMSGTSVDGIDAALVSIENGTTRLQHTHSADYDPELRSALFDLMTGVDDSIHTLGKLDRAVGIAFADATNTLLKRAGREACDITAIGSHGQTVRHYPSADPQSRYSLQIGDAATIAEITGITTVADFRRRDIAAGGEGAPLVPLFHAAQFGVARENRAIVNIGGIANATLLEDNTVIAGFDCGPGNTLLDHWIRQKLGREFDAGGAWSAEHDVIPRLLDALCAEEFFNAEGPVSTGPELFNLAWLDTKLQGDESPGDVQATLAELTAIAITQSIERCTVLPDAVYVCGGGARNTDLMRRLHRRLEAKGIRLGTTDELGLAAEWVEASAFAWLAHRKLENLPGNAPVVTAADGERVLGAVFEKADPDPPG